MITPHVRIAVLIVAALAAVSGVLVGDVGGAWRALLLGAPPAFL